MSRSLMVRATGIVVLLLAAFSGIAVVVVDRAEAAVVDVERPRLQASAAQLADAVSYGVLAHSSALLQAPLAAFAENQDLSAVAVFDDRGALLVEHQAAHVAEDVPDVVVEADVVTRGSVPGDDGDLEAFGITAGPEQRVGRVRVSYALSGVREVQQRLRKAIFTSVAGIGLFGLMAAAALASGVVQRIRQLASAARRVSGGELNTTVVIIGDDELSQLGRDFNAMTASLVVQQQRLHEQGLALAERESLAALGRATAVIAHELRNPLGIVLAAAEIVQNEAKPLRARVEAAGLIEEEVLRLERTLADLLAYARPRAAVCSTLDVVQSLRQVSSRITATGGPAEHVNVVVAGVSVALVVADDAFVQQIVWNLVQNAAQAGAQRVTLTVQGNDGVVVVAVADNGPGIAKEVRDQLFQPFSTTKQRGIGLGLSASRRMAQDMGGDLRNVDVDSAVGACFVFTLRWGSP